MSLREYFPGDIYEARPRPIYIVTVTTVLVGGDGRPETLVAAPRRTREEAECQAELLKLDICVMAYKDMAPADVRRQQDALFEELQKTQTVVVQVHETFLPAPLS